VWTCCLSRMLEFSMHPPVTHLLPSRLHLRLDDSHLQRPSHISQTLPFGRWVTRPGKATGPSVAQTIWGAPCTTPSHTVWHWSPPPPRRACYVTLGTRTFPEPKCVRIWLSTLPSAVKFKNSLGKYFSEGAHCHSHAPSPAVKTARCVQFLLGQGPAFTPDLTQTKA
jgi:hypothetical protein